MKRVWTRGRWAAPVVANSALMFGYARKDWRAGWDGWSYVDTVSDGNRRRQALKKRSPKSAAGPVGVCQAHDFRQGIPAGRIPLEHFGDCRRHRKIRHDGALALGADDIEIAKRRI